MSMPASPLLAPGRHSSPTPGSSPPSSHKLHQVLQEKVLPENGRHAGCQRKPLGPSLRAGLLVMQRAFTGSPLWMGSPPPPRPKPSHFPFLVPNFLLLVTSHQLLSLQRVSSPLRGRKACLSPMCPALPKSKDTCGSPGFTTQMPGQHPLAVSVP